MAADATVTSAGTVEDTSTVRRPAPAHLTPFVKGDPRAIEAGRKGGEARRATRAAQAASARQIAAVLGELRQTFDRDQLGPDAAAAAAWVIGRVVAGKVPVRNADEAATLLRALVDVARIEAGEATSTAVVAHIGTGAAAEVLALRDQARRALGRVVDVDSDEDDAAAQTAG